MSIFNKIIQNLRPNKDAEKTTQKLSDELKHADLDYKFVQLFTHSGGYFSYCEDERVVLQNLQQIQESWQVDNFFCCDEDLNNFLDVLKIPYTQALSSQNNAALVTCEFLIAFDGRIVLSDTNIKQYSGGNLPKKIIIVANVSQIVANLNDAMMNIKRRGGVKNLTSISPQNFGIDSPSTNNTKLFLLLLED